MPSKQGVFSEEIVTHWFKDDRCIAMKGNRQRRLYDVKTAGTNTRINNSNHPWADLDAHSDFQTDQVATYDHSHVWSAQEAFALFPSVNSGSSGARPLEGYLYEGKKGDQPCSEHGTAAASVDRGDGVDVKERNH